MIVLRVLFLLAAGWAGYLWGGMVPYLPTGLPVSSGVLGVALGLIAGGLVIGIDLVFKRISVRNLMAVMAGLILGLVLNLLLGTVLRLTPLTEDVVREMGLVGALIFSYLGAIVVLRGQEEFHLLIPFVKLDSKGTQEDLIVLDTSVIIDGRIADMCETSFLSGKLIIPRFVLKELQLIADSEDPLKRNRGRRGLDVLNRIKANQRIEVRIHETDWPEIRQVDAKLVKLGQLLSARVFTNDFNLNKVAELQGVKVLNINELANALKPVVMPGEELELKVIKEGKEAEQGVAYLDDGTMIVIDNGRRRIGQNVTVIVTSVLQTPAGRMIFAKMRGGQSSER